MISSICNSACGLGIVTAPWAVSKAGLAQSLVILLFFAVVIRNSAMVIVQSAEKIREKNGAGELPEYTVIVKYHLGKVAEYAAVWISFIYGFVANVLNFLLIVQVVYHKL